MPRSACCCLHSSSWHLIRSGWDLLLVMFPFVWVLSVYKLGFGFLELVSTGTRTLPFHFLLISPCSQPTYLQAPGAHPTRFYIWAPYKFLDGCVACTSPKSELCPSGACQVVASLTELSPVTRLQACPSYASWTHLLEKAQFLQVCFSMLHENSGVDSF